MFATSVAYPVASVDAWLGILLSVNPTTQLIEAFRAVVLYGHLPVAAPFGSTACVSMVGWHLFHKAEFVFAEDI